MRSILVLSFAVLVVVQNSALAQVENMSKEELKEIMATMINLRGHLCASSIAVVPARFATSLMGTTHKYQSCSSVVGRLREEPQPDVIRTLDGNISRHSQEPLLLVG